MNMQNEDKLRSGGGWRLIARFAAASLVAFVVIGLALSLLVSAQLVEQQEQAAEQHAEFVTNSILRYQINETDLAFLKPMEGQRYERLLRYVRRRILQHPLVLVRIWRSDGMVVFSSARRDVGRKVLPLHAGLRQAFTAGRTVNVVEATDGRLDSKITGLPSKVVKTYVPVFLGSESRQGAPVAAVEAYTDYTVVQEQVTRLFRTLVEILAGGLLGLYLLLLPIVLRVSGKLAAQANRMSVLLKREQHAQAERRKLLDRTLRAAEEERIKIAAELHDGPVQRLAQLGYGLERVRLRLKRRVLDGSQELLEEIQKGAFEEVLELRNMMSQLRPPVLDQRGLEEALRDRAEAVEREAGLQCVVDADLGTRLDSGLETVLYRVSQEALTNVIKHARAHRVEVSLHRDNGSVELEIRDDGAGFEPALTEGNGQHFGLMAMRERVEMIGGTWHLESKPGQGTRIKAVLPYERHP